MVFIELIGALFVGTVLGGLSYFLVTAGVLQLAEQIDLITPCVLSVLLFSLLIGWKFDYSLVVFFSSTSSDITDAQSAISSIVARLKYVFLVIGYILGTKISFKTVSR
ncbi:MAG: ABC-type uncharacterized transport system permease subunit [Alteromonadaceae bacterium]|jgi:ABC-type uncharacterized transport system permease subunit